MMYKIRILFIACIWLCCSGWAFAQEVTLITETPETPVVSEGQVKLEWNANAEADLAGYQIHYGELFGVYDNVINVGNVTSYAVKGLEVGKPYHFVLTAYDTSRNESGYSEGVSVTGKDHTGPDLPSGLRESVLEITIIAETINIVPPE